MASSKQFQGQIFLLSVSIFGSQSLEKLNSCFQFIKRISHDDTDNQIFQRSAANVLIFPLKSSGDGALLQDAPTAASKENSVWGIFTCIALSLGWIKRFLEYVVFIDGFINNYISGEET